MTEYRPLDFLNRSINKKIIVELKNGKQYIGLLNSFDMYTNLVLDETEEMHGGEVKRKIGTVFIRGDTILMIS